MGVDIGANPTVERGARNRRERMSEREWRTHIDREVDALSQHVRELQDDRDETARRLDALRAELRAHTLAVTREGWHYVATGAVLTGLGIILTLV
jgi:hypothetical protein